MLREVIEKGHQKAIEDYVNGTHPYDLAAQFEGLTEAETDVFLRSISDAVLADFLSFLKAEDAAQVFEKLDVIKQKTLVDMMEPDDATDVIQELDRDVREELEHALEADSAIRELIAYEEDETGSAMTNRVVVLHPQMDIKTATKKVIQEAPLVESINTLFVTDEEGVFQGVVMLRDLIKTKAPSKVATIMREHPFVFATDPITKSAQALRNYGIYEMPVLDRDGTLRGMLTLDDALDLYREEAQEDFEKLAALPETIEGPSYRVALHRLPWLVILLGFSIPIALVTSLFEEVLSAVAILIVFQPLILGSAGNVATQTLAVTLKLFASDEKRIGNDAKREILAGMINGFFIGLIAFLMTYLFSVINDSLTTAPLTMSLVVGLSLWLTVIIAPIIAIAIPVTLRALKFDPAVASGPFITTIIDIAALFIYFGLATMMLGGVI
jgi:magnesium transporter